MARNIALTIEYCGANYSGWQIQQNAPTVQGAVEDALSELCGEDIHVCGCSRTDAGVHADNFVLNFRTDSTIPATRFPAALSAFLPGDIAAKSAREVPDSFHARFDAVGKTYRYLIHLSPLPSALLWQRVWHVKMPELSSLSETTLTRRLKKVNTAASHVIGTHDFMAFRAEGSNVKTTMRTILRAEVNVIPPSVTVPCPLLCFEITGDGFLYNMVRIMVGTLLDIQRGKLEPDSIPAILQSRSRERAGVTAPGEGLFLNRVFYQEGGWQHG